jgi:hypothetical protein
LRITYQDTKTEDSTKTVVFVPLAFGTLNGVIGENAKVRCNAAVREIRTRSKISCPRMVIGLGAGTPPQSKNEKTLAQYSQEFLQETGADIPTFVNQDDHKVFGTFSEIQWVVQKAQELYSNPHFVFVSQKRHIRRIRIICYLFYPKTTHFQFVVCGQVKIIPLTHEFFAYGELMLIKLGCTVDQLEKLRNFVHRLIR